jgi:hypothetical protein
MLDAFARRLASAAAVAAQTAHALVHIATAAILGVAYTFAIMATRVPNAKGIFTIDGSHHNVIDGVDTVNAKVQTVAIVA